jgi:hypothetical protein
VFRVRYEYHLYENSKDIFVTGRGGLEVCVFPVTYEHHLHINSKNLPATGTEGVCCQ